MPMVAGCLVLKLVKSRIFDYTQFPFRMLHAKYLLSQLETLNTLYAFVFSCFKDCWLECGFPLLIRNAIVSRFFNEGHPVSHASILAGSLEVENFSLAFFQICFSQ